MVPAQGEVSTRPLSLLVPGSRLRDVARMASRSSASSMDPRSLAVLQLPGNRRTASSRAMSARVSAEVVVGGLHFLAECAGIELEALDLDACRGRRAWRRRRSCRRSPASRRGGRAFDLIRRVEVGRAALQSAGLGGVGATRAAVLLVDEEEALGVAALLGLEGAPVGGAIVGRAGAHDEQRRARAPRSRPHGPGRWSRCPRGRCAPDRCR